MAWHGMVRHGMARVRAGEGDGASGAAGESDEDGATHRKDAARPTRIDCAPTTDRTRTEPFKGIS